MPLVNCAPRIFVRKPPSVTFQGSLEFGTGGTIFAALQHPTQAYVFAVINSGISVFDISNRAAPSLVGVVADAVGLIGNQTLHGLAFDPTGRYLYATSGATSLYTFDLGAAFATIEDPPLVDTETISQGNGKHVLKVTDGRLFSLADTVTNNSFQELDITTPSTPTVSSTTALTGHDLEALAGHVSADTILYPASDTSGKIVAVPIDAPTLFEVLQLPTIGGRQIRCTSGIAFSPNGLRMTVNCFFVNGTINHYLPLEYDIETSFATANAPCTNEEIVGGAIASLRSRIIASSPKHAEFSGHYWNDGNNVLHLAIAVRDDSFTEPGEIRFYAWGAGGEFSRAPRFSGATSIPGSWSMRAANEGTDKTEWLCIGVSADRSNALLALLKSDLLVSNPDYVNDWHELTADKILSPENIVIEYGNVNDGHVAQTGTAEFALDNSQHNDTSNLGGYSPDSASQVTEDFQDGSPIVITVDTNGFDDLAFYGVVSSIRVVPGILEERIVKVTCKDGIEEVVVANVERLPLLSNISTEEALQILWDRVPYRPGTEVLHFEGEKGTFIHELVFDRGFDEKTKNVGEIVKLLDASLGFFVNRNFTNDGTRTGMTYVSLDAYKKASVMFRGAAPILTDINLLGMVPERETSDVYNVVTVRYYPRDIETAAPPTTTLFKMSERVLIRPGETVTIDASYRDPGGLASRVGGTDMVYPVAGDDYSLRPKKNGGGTNIDAQASVSAEFGATASRIIASNAGPGAGWFETKLTGNAVRSFEPGEITVEDQDSITKYGRKELPQIYDAFYISDERKARALAKAILAASKDLRTFIRSNTFSVDFNGFVIAAALTGPTGKIGVQEQVTGLVYEDYWRLGAGLLDDTSGSDATNLYGLDIYSVQRVKLTIKQLSLLDCELTLIPEDLVFRTPAWIDPKDGWTNEEPLTENLFNIHLRDSVNAIWHEKTVQTADVTKTADTAFEDLPGCSFEILAGETRQFFAILFIDSNATANAKATVVAVDVNGGDINAQVFGHIGLWGSGAPVTQGHTATFGGNLNYAITGTDEEVAMVSGVVTSPVDATIKIQGAQNSSSGTTVFRTLSPVVHFLLEEA